MAKISKERKVELLKVKLSEILIKSSSNPLFEGVTVVDIKTSSDFSSATVFYAIYGADINVEKVTNGLNKAGGFFQSKLSKTLHTRNTPRLKFIYDPGFDNTTRIENILSGISIKEEEEE